MWTLAAAHSHDDSTARALAANEAATAAAVTCGGSPERTESEKPPDRLQGRVLIFAGVGLRSCFASQVDESRAQQGRIGGGREVRGCGSVLGWLLPVRELVGEI